MIRFRNDWETRIDMGGQDYEIDQYPEWLERAGIVMLEELGQDMRCLFYVLRRITGSVTGTILWGRCWGRTGAEKYEG